MIFVGRENEKKKIMEALQLGGNIILSGKFGIGRTSLIKEVARLLGEQRLFLFVDFAQTPSKISEKIVKGLHISALLKKSGKKMGYKSMRYRITTFRSSIENKPVIVLDNVANLTRQKIIFLRHLIEEQNFQFIAIVENFLSKNNLFEIKALLLPAKTLILCHFKKEDIKNLLSIYAKQHQFRWTENYINNLATLSNGYPLGLAEMLGKRRNAQRPRREITEKLLIRYS